VYRNQAKGICGKSTVKTAESRRKEAKRLWANAEADQVHHHEKTHEPSRPLLTEKDGEIRVRLGGSIDVQGLSPGVLW
jgi:hypothetical protein